jgi:DNA-binding NarL/FixJ family response regulator
MMQSSPSLSHAGDAQSILALRVLLADDDLAVRRGFRAVLGAQEDIVICAECGDGREALDLVMRHKPHIAIIDLSLPSLNGLEATRRIRQMSPATRVLVFTVHEEDDWIRKARGAGARGYLLKSDDDAQIVAAICALAQGRSYFPGLAAEALESADGASARETPLTAREREVVQLVAEGHSNKRIGRTLGISVKTVENHRSTAMRKVGARTLADVVRYALRQKLVQA